MATGELEEAKIAADGVESFARFGNGAVAEGAGRNRARFGPSFEYRFSVIVVQRSKVNTWGAKGKLQIRKFLRHLNIAKQHEDEQNKHDCPQRPARSVTPGTAVRPSRDRSDQKQNQNHQ